MNRRSFPEEIDAPQLNSRGRYVYYGHDASTARQLSALARRNEEIGQLGPLLDEEYVLSESEQLYVLTRDKYNSYISSAVAHLGEHGLKRVYWLDENERKEFEGDFKSLVDTSIAGRYPHAS